MRRLLIVAAAAATLTACATEPSPPIHPVAAQVVPRDDRGETVVAAIRPLPGTPVAPLVKPVKPVSCLHLRRCP